MSGQDRSAGWVLRPALVEPPSTRLFLLHNAGGSPAQFRTWLPRFPDAWEVCAVALPRGKPWRQAVDSLAEELLAWTDLPYGLFGHSMGGLVAAELAGAAARGAGRLPAWVGVSSYPWPEPVQPPGGRDRHRLPSAELRGLLARFGGIPEVVLRNEGLWPLIEPRLREHLELLDSRARGTGVDRTVVPGCGLSAFCGRDDPVAGPAEVSGWRMRVTDFRGLHAYPGGHFYFQSRSVLEALVPDIVADLRACLAGDVQPGRR